MQGGQLHPGRGRNILTLLPWTIDIHGIFPLILWKQVSLNHGMFSAISEKWRQGWALFNSFGGWIMSVGENVFDKYVKGELSFQFKHTLPICWSTSNCKPSHSKIPLMLARQAFLSIHVRCEKMFNRSFWAPSPTLQAGGLWESEKRVLQRLRESPRISWKSLDSPSCTNTFVCF